MKIEVGRVYEGILDRDMVNIYVHEIHVGGAKGPRITFSWAMHPEVPYYGEGLDWTFRLQRSGAEFKRYLQAFAEWDGKSVQEVEL
jgi:hypothetical protein